jgi:hypothetical protein
MRTLSMVAIASACAALVITSAPAVAQKKSKEQAYTECVAEMGGRGVSGDARKQQMQSCMKRKMRGK